MVETTTKPTICQKEGKNVQKITLKNKRKKERKKQLNN